MENPQRNDKTIYILGAGASRGYYLSKTGIYPPLAKDYFSTFYNLDISADLEVKIGFIVNYLRDTRGIQPDQIPTDFNENIEEVFAEVDLELRRYFDAVVELPQDYVTKRFNLVKAYDQFIFWFSHVLNEIQNGPSCPIYNRLIEVANPGDTFITFNWDTLLDKALANSGLWHPDDGYMVQFDGILEKKWRSPIPTKSSYILLKLHGSTNWFGPYVSYNLQDGRRQWLASEENVYRNWCLIDGTEWFNTYKDRWRPGYESFSYFFSPNDPIELKPLMPIVIPPTEEKRFGEYNHVFGPIWQEARRKLSEGNRLIICGYSFPRTDGHAYSLLDTFLEVDTENKAIEIVDPFPSSILDRVSKHIRDRCKIQVHEKTLAQYLSLDVETHIDSKIKSITLGTSKEQEEDQRLLYIISILAMCSINNFRFDLTTFDGQRYLNIILAGEFATHLYGAFKTEVFDYRINNIPILLDGKKKLKVRRQNIWIVHPLVNGQPSDKDVEGVDISKANDVLKQMISAGYHCKDTSEEEYFLRRFLAS